MTNDPEAYEPPSRAVELPIWFMAVVTTPVLLGVLWFGKGFLIPLVVAGLLLILTNAIVDRIESVRIGARHAPRWLAHILSFSITVLALVLLGTILSAQAGEIEAAAPRYQDRANAILANLTTLFGAEVIEAARRAFAEIDLGAVASGVLDSLGGVLGDLVLIILYFGFLLAEQNALASRIIRICSNEQQAVRASATLKAISNGVERYMWINAVTSAMSGVVAYLIFSFVGLDFAETLALLVFIFGFVPSIGAFLAIAGPSIIALVQFDTYTPFLIVLFGYGLADQFIANVIQPAMQGKSLNLSSFMVMVSLAFWGLLWGAIGAFLAVPMMVVTMIICAEIPALRAIAILLSGDGDLPGGAPEQSSEQGVPPSGN